MSSTMQLNIKNPETRRLALELARITGETVTDAVTTALRERLERKNVRSKAGVAEKLMEIGSRWAALPERDPHDADDILYDEAGLPK